MFYEIVIRDVVHQDIDELSDYILKVSSDKNIALKVYNILYGAIFGLDFLPSRFEKYVGEYRRLIVNGNYKIYYKIDEKLKKVIIMRVLRSESNTDEI